MNRSLLDVQGEAMVVSQFTLHGNARKGTRPSFVRAAGPDLSIPLYEDFVKKLGSCIEQEVATGEFGAYMQVELCNDGPVTLILDTKQKKF
jgi:D-tyrosyl-tRNA(Tyr) deacylase